MEAVREVLGEDGRSLAPVLVDEVIVVTMDRRAIKIIRAEIRSEGGGDWSWTSGCLPRLEVEM